MKINTTIKFLAIGYTLAFTHNSHTFINDNFEEEFIAKMNSVQQQIENATQDMQSTLKEFHKQVFDDLPTRINNFPIYNQSKNVNENQNSINYYQQSSSSLAFRNNEKAITIKEQRDPQTTTYIINVTDETAHNINNDASLNQESNITVELEELAAYIKKRFNSKSAHKILEECLTAINKEQKDIIMTSKVAKNGNQKEYVVEIPHKEEAPVVQTKKSRKTKSN